MRENDAWARRVTLRGIARTTFVICRCPGGVKCAREHTHTHMHTDTHTYTEGQIGTYTEPRTVVRDAAVSNVCRGGSSVP